MDEKDDRALLNCFKLIIRYKKADFNGMNCRRLAVIVIFPCVLVHIGEGAHAADPTYRQATATATILPSVTTERVADGRKQEKARKSIGSQPVMEKFIDQDGFITSASNPVRHIIIITDLP